MRKLWPPLGVIEARLQARQWEDSPNDDSPLAEVGDPAVSAEVPAFIALKIRQRVASQQAAFSLTPAPGKIMRFDGEEERVPPQCVLLDREISSDIWRGWLVSAETDYASNRDVLLEPQDEPFDPIASMVQTWNELKVDVRKAGRVLAHLSEERLEAIREVARGECEDGGKARLGFVAPLLTHMQRQVLSGTPVSHAQDPRRHYQALYRDAAKQLQVSHAITAEIVPFPARKRTWSTAGWAMAASIVLVQSIVIANLLRDKTETNAAAQGSQYSEYRAASVPDQAAAFLEVYFKPEAKEMDIRKLLASLNASIVSGPGEYGQWRLRVDADKISKASEELKRSGLVDEVRPVPAPQ